MRQREKKNGHQHSGAPAQARHAIQHSMHADRHKAISIKLTLLGNEMGSEEELGWFLHCDTSGRACKRARAQQASERLQAGPPLRALFEGSHHDLDTVRKIIAKSTFNHCNFSEPSKIPTRCCSNIACSYRACSSSSRYNAHAKKPDFHPVRDDSIMNYNT